MKNYAVIYLGKRWTPEFPWGITVEADGKPAILLCFGCAEEQAKELVRLLNRHQVKSARGKIAAAAAVLPAAILFTGCTMMPLKGGKATTSQTAGHINQSVTQGDNPAQASRQDQETVKTRTYTVPAGSRLASTSNQVVIVSAPMPVVEHEETRARTELGAAQKDTARELSAKLASLKGIVWVGVVLFLFGLATLFYPPLKLLIGSMTTSAAICAGGVALMILPSLVVGNELLILAGVAAAVGLWFLAHRHGQLRGLVDAGLSTELKTGKTPDNS